MRILLFALVLFMYLFSCKEVSITPEQDFNTSFVLRKDSLIAFLSMHKSVHSKISNGVLDLDVTNAIFDKDLKSAKTVFSGDSVIYRYNLRKFASNGVKRYSLLFFFTYDIGKNKNEFFEKSMLIIDKL